MWWRSAARLAVLALAVAVSGCGFHPLYGRQHDVALTDSLARVEVGPIKDRVGQQVRNALLDAFTPGGLRGDPLYYLDVLVTEGITSLAVRKSADATRADLQLTASYRLMDRRTGEAVLATDSRAVSSFNILNSEFATLMAEKSARDRAVQQLSDEIRLKVSVFLRDYTKKTGTK